MPTADPEPLLGQNPGDTILDSAEKPEPPPAQEPTTSQKPISGLNPPRETSNVKMREAYQRLRNMKCSDIHVQLHEQLRNLDAKWLARLLVAVVMDHRQDVQDEQNLHILTGKDTIGSVLLLKDLMGAQIDVMSIVLTKEAHRADFGRKC